jgi:hypothetical protein
MTNSYSISQQAYRLTKKLFFHSLHLMIRLALVRNTLEHAAMRRPLPQSPLGRYPALSSTIFHLEEAN